jgi:hypothetical protein
MLDNIYFYIVFLSQILLISYYYPKRILSRASYVLETYPKAEYPKLYLKSTEYYNKKLRNFRIINQIILVVGFILMYAVGMWDYSTDLIIEESIPFLYFMLQASPLILLEISGFTYFKLMRKSDKRTSRKADLQPRRLFDFISPAIVGPAIFLYIACILFFYNLHQFQFHLSNDTFVIAISLTASNILFAGIIYWNLYGKKLNPYQTSGDRLKQLEVTIKSLVFMSIMASSFLMILEGIEAFELDYLVASLMSLYLQFTVVIGLGSLLRNLRVENIDFKVYKEDVSVN